MMTIQELDSEAKLIIDRAFENRWTPKDLTIISALLLNFSAYMSSKKDTL